MTLVELEARVGGLSRPSKIPGYCYSVPAKACKTGGKLVKVVGSVCEKCYALKGRYGFENVQVALRRRLDLMNKPEWREHMIELLRHPAVLKTRWFRWFDSGDIQSPENLLDIIAIALAVPEMTFWLPTKEYRISREVTAEMPANLCLRISLPMIDQEKTQVYAHPTSGVVKDREAFGWQCPAPTQGNSCGDCRTCWDKSVAHVSYHAH
jgi:hypothetical protein